MTCHSWGWLGGCYLKTIHLCYESSDNLNCQNQFTQKMVWGDEVINSNSICYTVIMHNYGKYYGTKILTCIFLKLWLLYVWCIFRNIQCMDHSLFLLHSCA